MPGNGASIGESGGPETVQFGDSIKSTGPETLIFEQDRSHLFEQTLAPTNPYKGLRPFQTADADDFFGREALVEQLTLRLRETGDLYRFLAVVGPSGCGKSTLLKIMAGLIPPTKGRVILQNRPVTGPRRDIGMMFQQATLFPWKTAVENIVLPIEIRDGKAAAKTSVDVASDRFS